MIEIKYKEWTRIPWDGNPALNLECWRKSFGRGHVSVGIGEFLNVVFSFGANSDDSYSGTRWNYGNPPIEEDVMMRELDKAWRKTWRKKPGTFSIPKHLYNRPADWDDRKLELNDNLIS